MDISLVSPRIVAELQGEPKAFTGTKFSRLNGGKPIELKGYVELRWTLQLPLDVRRLPPTEKSRFYVPAASRPPFDALMSVETAHKYKLLGKHKSTVSGCYFALILMARGSWNPRAVGDYC